jgi:hypothetical protein
LRGFLAKIESLYGKAERIWVMDRGIPIEEVLGEMRASGRVIYVIGTPRGRLTKLEATLVGKPWERARPNLSQSWPNIFKITLASQRHRLCMFPSARPLLAKPFPRLHLAPNVGIQKYISTPRRFLEITSTAPGVKKRCGSTIRVSGLISTASFVRSSIQFAYLIVI